MSSDLNSGQHTYDMHLVNTNSYYSTAAVAGTSSTITTIATFAIIAAIITTNRITLTLTHTAWRS